MCFSHLQVKEAETANRYAGAGVEKPEKTAAWTDAKLSMRGQRASTAGISLRKSEGFCSGQAHVHRGGTGPTVGDGFMNQGRPVGG